MVHYLQLYSTNKVIIKLTLPLLLLLIPTVLSGSADSTSDLPTPQHNSTTDQTQSLRYKLAAISSILVAGAIGVTLPLLATKLDALNPDNDIFFMVKAFAAGVILATAFIHILPEAFHRLTSPSLHHKPWGDFPFAGFVAMMSAIATLMLDSFATSFYQRLHFNNPNNKDHPILSTAVNEDGYTIDEHAGHIHVHAHATDGHAHGSAAIPPYDSQLIRHRIISQVLELGIVVHSVIIGISLGASQSLETIKPLLAALSFHQFFEGMGLGGCISQAKFKSLSTVIMAVFFTLTTPLGIAIGIGISSVYKENSPTALILEGTFNSASAGILIYMALVDLLAADFMNPKMQTNSRLQLGANISLLLGAGSMSVLAKWA